MAKRGRPVKKLEELDSIVSKRRVIKPTGEAIDICLTRNLISVDEHRAGLKLRWLYFMKFGSPFVRSINLAEPRGRSVQKPVDPNMLAEAEKIYREIIQELDSINARKVVTDVCIFNIYPGFIYSDKIIYSLKYILFANGIKATLSLLEKYKYLR